MFGYLRLLKVIRVFPRRTKATPADDLAYVGPPDLFATADQVQISVSFTWDIPEAERLAKAWAHVAPVEVGGPAYNAQGSEFEPGRFLKPGYVITSRGCPNRCWFCSVWKRETGIKELAIKDGWIIQDDNLLACSEQHIRAVFDMLGRQGKRPVFSGGLEARLLESWHVDLLHAARPAKMFFAYDTPDDYEPLIRAVGLLQAAGFKRWHIYCYVLIGWPQDTWQAAEKRLSDVVRLGITPFAMLYRDKQGRTDPTWRKLARAWMRPALIFHKASE